MTRQRRALAPETAPHLPLLYAAYGSNLHKASMRRRCPAAAPAGVVLLPGWRLVMRAMADIEPAVGCRVPVGLWRVTAADLAALDCYEETPDYYRRRVINLPAAVDGARQAMIYVMHDHRSGPPSADYVQVCAEGYTDFGFDPRPLWRAIAAGAPPRRHAVPAG